MYYLQAENMLPSIPLDLPLDLRLPTSLKRSKEIFAYKTCQIENI